MTISATCTWRAAGSSKVELMTSPRTVRCISVTSSGRSSISSTIRCTSGWLVVIAVATCCIIIVLPAFGWETMSERWPLPCGAIRSRMRPVMSSDEPLPRSRVKRRRGNSAVRFSNSTLFFEASIGAPLRVATMFSAK
ncbi:hypothetical protein G6F68_017104 [Rhizopus microsporus]|nr:hypothetical protein G6F68_017104 [Rhizopus microsporus]